MTLAIDITASLAFSAIAVVVSIASFYLSRLSPGRLRMVGDPPMYSVDGTLFRVPITLNNPGARVAVVGGLRIRFPERVGGDYAWSNSLCDSTELGTPTRLFQPVPVPGGGSEVLVIEFHLARRVDAIITETGPYNIEVAVVRPRHFWNRGPKPRWRNFRRPLRLYVTEVELNGFGSPFGHWNGLRELDD